MRFLPEQQVVCHVCGTPYTVTTQLDAIHGIATHTPSVCPACGAPRKTVPPRDVGHAKGLLLTHGGVRWYVDRYGDAARYLEQHSLREADVDAYLALVDALDWDAWEADERRVRHPTADERETLAVLPRLRADAASGRLREELGAAAAQVKETLRSERERHLARLRRPE